MDVHRAQCEPYHHAWQHFELILKLTLKLQFHVAEFHLLNDQDAADMQYLSEVFVFVADC